MRELREEKALRLSMCTCNYSVSSYVQIACKPRRDSDSQPTGLKYRSSTEACRKVSCSSGAPDL